MTDISTIDKNFKIETSIDLPDVQFYQALSEPFEINGVFYEDGKFRRMPEDVAKNVSKGVLALHANTAGGRVRFKTNSPYVAISVKMAGIGKMPHFALCGSAGFDVYADGCYSGSLVPPFAITDGYENVLKLGKEKDREITLNMPLYSDVCELYIGLKKGASVKAPTPYTIDKPIVYYGSSVTQGGCASRPGTSYQSFVSRTLNADFINLGFSGNAKGEDEMAEYIKSLEMSAFVYDYDYNAPSVEHLKATHEKMFLKIRKEHPSLPIIILSRPRYQLDREGRACLKVIRKTYENALERGDKNVCFIDGKALMRWAKNDGTVDNCHPTDLGFYSMARELTKALKKLL